MSNLSVQAVKELFSKKIPRYQKDPVLFFKDVTRFEPDDWQSRVARDLAEYPRVSVKSGHGVGKTALEANLVLWFLSCFPFARVVVTAPTQQQLHDVLWAEIDKWRSRSPFLKELLVYMKTHVYMRGFEKRWFAVAKTAAKPENMQGFHEDNMLFVADEASGIEDEIMETILGTLSGANNRLLMCANPTRTTGTFYDSHTIDRGIYKCHTISSLDSARTNKDNIASFIRKYGKDSNIVKVRVYGEFPTQEDDVFIWLSTIEHACNREIDLTKKIPRIAMGVDVARYGDDETIIVDNVGGKCEIVLSRRGQDLMKTVGDIVLEYRRLAKMYPQYNGKIFAVIDDTGLGGGVTDRLKEVKREQKLSRLEIIPINFGSKVPEEQSVFYADFPTFLWANIRDKLEEGTLQLQDDQELIAQLSVRKYTVSSSGKLQIESKKEMKKRGVGSPDRGDALALSCYEEVRFDITSLIS